MNITKKLFLKTAPVRCRPSRLITDELVSYHLQLVDTCLKHSALHTAPLKEITSRELRRTGWPSNVAINVAIFGTVSKANSRWSADLR